MGVQSRINLWRPPPSIPPPSGLLASVPGSSSSESLLCGHQGGSRGERVAKGEMQGEAESRWVLKVIVSCSAAVHAHVFGQHLLY